MAAMPWAHNARSHVSTVVTVSYTTAGAVLCAPAKDHRRSRSSVHTIGAHACACMSRWTRHPSGWPRPLPWLGAHAADVASVANGDKVRSAGALCRCCAPRLAVRRQALLSIVTRAARPAGLARGVWDLRLQGASGTPGSEPADRGQDGDCRCVCRAAALCPRTLSPSASLPAQPPSYRPSPSARGLRTLARSRTPSRSRDRSSTARRRPSSVAARRAACST
eukprot:scaffold296470_cov31-Tisochrysis_lutea.AAC.2